MSVQRLSALALLAVVLCFYTWFAFREDGRLKTVPGVPHTVWYYFDHHSTVRNGVGFLILGFVGSAAVAGLRPEAQVLSMVLCVSAPIFKDLAQLLFTLTRHFNWGATGLGLLGAFLGWWIGFWLIGRIRSHRSNT
jgi:hypothetical protein